MPPDLQSVVPRYKHDVESAEAVTRLSFSEIQPILPALLEWLQDPNWPVAQILTPHLAKIGEPLAPYVRTVMSGDDGAWKYNLIHSLVLPSRALCESVATDLRRIALRPTENDKQEEVHLAALAALQELEK